jgi:type VII secretion-associated protein (TIGR03931 family)
VTTADGAVVILGPNAIRGPGVVDEALARVALECIDDRLALVDDRAVPVERLWREVTCAAAGARQEVVVVVPSWWTRRRSSFVAGALSECLADVVVLRRAEVLRGDDSRVVVEIATELIAVHANSSLAAIPRSDDGAAVRAVVERIGSPSAVVIDVPPGVADAGVLAEEIGRLLRARGTSVSVADDETVLRMVLPARRRPPRRHVRPRVAALTASALSVAALTCAAVGSGADAPVGRETAWVIEGRVAVEVPADWPVERVTTGPGSARLQAVSPADPQMAIHLTQSPVPAQQSLTSAAEVLRNALATQPDGVFVDFKTADRRADRAVITYRELRPDHHVDWAVFLDGGVRIAIGCQRAPDRPWPDSICDTAIRSARVLIPASG